MTKHPVGATLTTFNVIELAIMAHSLNRRVKSLRKLTATSVAIIEAAEKPKADKEATK